MESASLVFMVSADLLASRTASMTHHQFRLGIFSSPTAKWLTMQKTLVEKKAVPTLGVLLRGLRSRNGWTLKRMSAESGIPISTLSKVEHDRLTLTYDKLYQLSQRLGMRMSELFSESSEQSEQPVTGRRSVGDISNAVRVQTPNYDYYYLCTELRRKRMIPVVAKIRAKSLEEFGELIRHAGEEFFFVVKGRIVVHTEFYDPVTLDEGQTMYIDSMMGHAYLVAEGCEEAEIIGAMASGDDELMPSLLEIHEEQRRLEGADGVEDKTHVVT